MAETETLTLISPGCLGTCWYGNYHYLEPWAGCEHACVYCYACCRSVVNDKLEQMETSYTKPKPLFEENELLANIASELRDNKVKTLKLCRFTDILTPSFKKSGLTYKILKTICESDVERIIITTKGKPDEDILSLIREYPQKFSFNVAAKPDSGVRFEPYSTPLNKRLDGAVKAQEAGARVTIHMDPLITGFEDTEEVMVPFLEDLKKRGLNRVMFSYLLLSDDIIANMRKSIEEPVMEKVLSSYITDDSKQCLPTQAETTYFFPSPEARTRSVSTISGLLNKMGFDFVLCSIKNDPGTINIEEKTCPSCDGSFYA
ncbi:MAG: hypothetical protein LWY06_01170 [Firmicutes bacterium]|nr:hypothetical protein [Bacillota bacterium]